MKPAARGNPVSPKKNRVENVVLVGCNPHVIAISTCHVERLVLASEAPQPELVGNSPIPIIKIGKKVYAAWDLGELLELEPQKETWVLLQNTGLTSFSSVALRTGPCLAIRNLSRTWNMPKILRSRSAALGRAFLVSDVLALPDKAVIGYYLDISALWSVAEIEASAAALAEAKARQESSKHGVA